MGILIGLLTVILVLNCLILILLVLIQLPKKEAGAGIAFGGGATDALFGAGSGNALTKITKYSAGLFIGLSLLLSVFNVQRHGRTDSGVAEELRKKAAAGPLVTPAPTNTDVTPTSAPSFQLQTTTNAPAATSPPPAGQP